MAKRPAVVSPDLTPDWLEKRDRMTTELFRQLRQGITEPGKGMTLGQFQKCLEHQNPFASPDSIVGEWQEFYQDVFGWDTDFSNLVIPPECDGYGWLIVITKGLTMNLVFQRLTERTKTWRYTNDLDKAVTDNDREPKTDYCLWVRDRVEADEENKNLSTNQLKEKGIPGITLLERLILGLFYFWKSRGKHLDLKTVTLCSGSRGSDGSVPVVDLDSDGGVDVDWYNPNVSYGVLRARSVVSA